jgi:hypothetical protein
MERGIIIHISVGEEKRTEFFSDEHLSIGSDEKSELQIISPKISKETVLLELEARGRNYIVLKYDKDANLTLNDKSIRRFAVIKDGDKIKVGETDIEFSFFSFASKSSMIAVNRDQPHIAPFIEDAALEAAFTPQRDDAKVFLREFVRELRREVSWTTKMIVLVLALGFISGIFYIGYLVNTELRENREISEKQNQTIQKLQEKLGETSEQIGEIDKSNKDIIKTVSLAPNLRVEYGSGVCLIVGVYDLVDKKNWKTLRYRDPSSYEPDYYEQPQMPINEGDLPPLPPQNESSDSGLTTDGNGTPLEYDFIGTGFHVGGGYIVTNRHVVQPWNDDDLIKQVIKEANGRARIKKLVVYFPNVAQPITLKVRKLDYREDVAVVSIPPESIPPNLPVLPLETEPQTAQVGKTVVSMGYPNGPDRLLAMVEDDEAKSISSRCSGSRQCIINYLAITKKIVPLTTTGAITDLDAKRVVHDARTAEGGSGAPLFGQSGKVIGVNFGVFTGNTAANMAVPIRFAVNLLKQVGWISPDVPQSDATSNTTAAANTSVKPAQNN